MTDSQLVPGTDLATTNDDTATYAQYTTINIAEIMVRRGVSFKELAATAQSGMTYNPELRLCA